MRSRRAASVTNARAPLSASRYPSASGPNSTESGSATAPSLYTAMWATAVSMRWGRMIPTRSPRRMPRPASALAKRSLRRFSSANVKVRSSPRAFSKWSAVRSPMPACRSQMSTPML